MEPTNKTVELMPPDSFLRQRTLIQQIFRLALMPQTNTYFNKLIFETFYECSFDPTTRKTFLF